MIIYYTTKAAERISNKKITQSEGFVAGFFDPGLLYLSQTYSIQLDLNQAIENTANQTTESCCIIDDIMSPPDNIAPSLLIVNLFRSRFLGCHATFEGCGGETTSSCATYFSLIVLAVISVTLYSVKEARKS